jgi:3-oxoacyl-[acyl-carrier protein] reductase
MARRVLVTGASRGIGRAIADHLRAEGHVVECPCRSELDLSDAQGVDRFLLRNSGPWDILVNCAGENFLKPIGEVTDEHLQRTLQVNFISAFQLVRTLGKSMAERGWGRIINISSAYSALARPGRAPYSASKAALDALTRTAALELGPQGVLVNSVCPGFVDTELTRQNNSPERIQALASATALGRLALPDEIAQLVAFLSSERNTYLTGQNIIIDGGFSIQ